MKRSTRLLRESNALPGSGLRVDREAGVIHGVRVIGPKSQNGREYLVEALQRAIPLYEKASVRTNHPKRPDDQRDVHEVFGWLESVRQAPDGGLVADLHVLNPKSDLAESVFNAAERAPHLYGLSHNAQGEGETKGGSFVVHEITEIRSVDLVTDPATTKGLFESRGQPMKVRAFLEAVAGRLSKGRKARLVKLCEADELAPPMAGDMPPDAPAPDAGSTPDDALKAGFRAACQAVLDDEGLDAKGKLGKLKELLNTAEKLMASGADVPEEDEPDEDDKDMEESKKLRKEIADLKARESVRELCEAEGYRPTPEAMTALMGLTEKGRKALVEQLKGGSKSGGNPPRTQATSGTAAAPAQISDGKSFAEALRRGK